MRRCKIPWRCTRCRVKREVMLVAGGIGEMVISGDRRRSGLWGHPLRDEVGREVRVDRQQRLHHALVSEKDRAFCKGPRDVAEHGRPLVADTC